MTQPILLAFDENAADLAHIKRELEDRYGRHYEVVSVGSPDEARAQLKDFAASGVEVALVLAGQCRAGEPSCRLLEAVHDLHPYAKRAVLIAWTDWGDPRTGRSIFDGIADGRFDHYVIRPSLSPDHRP